MSAVATLIGGHALRGLHKQAAERLLKNDDFIKWALNREGVSTAAQIRASLGGLAGENSVIGPEVKALQKSRWRARGRDREAEAETVRDAAGARWAWAVRFGAVRSGRCGSRLPPRPATRYDQAEQPQGADEPEAGDPRSAFPSR